jgi:hypothetical protein
VEPRRPVAGQRGGKRFVTVWDGESFAERFTITASQTITGREINDTGAAGYVLDVAWSKDGSRFLVSDREGGVLVYSAHMFAATTDADWLAAAREQVTHELSPEEHHRFGFTT